MDPVLAKEIQNLIDDNRGDHHRLEFLLESIKNNKKVYNSDQKYLASLLSEHSTDDDILERLDSLNEKPEETVVTFADKDETIKPTPEKFYIPNKKPVNVTRMIIYSLIPFLDIYAAWRIQKFWVIAAIQLLVGFGLGFPLESLVPYPFGYVFSISISYVTLVYFVRHFARKYNEKINSSSLMD